MRKDLSIGKYLLFNLILVVIVITLAGIFGKHLKDYITKKTCPLMGGEYSKQEEECLIPVGDFK